MSLSLSRRQLLLATAAGAALVGCKALNATPEATPTTNEKGFKTLKLVYRTDTARLLHAAVASESLPNMHEATLVIEAPHPQGIPDQALAFVQLKPKDGEASAFTLNITQPAAGTESKPQTYYRYAELPLWQAEALIKKLRDDNFFQRSRSLNDEVHLSVKIDSEGFGKKYRAVPEIDAVIGQICREGRAEKTSIPFMADAIRRLPIVR